MLNQSGGPSAPPPCSDGRRGEYRLRENYANSARGNSRQIAHKHRLLLRLMGSVPQSQVSAQEALGRYFYFNISDQALQFNHQPRIFPDCHKEVPAEVEQRSPPLLTLWAAIQRRRINAKVTCRDSFHARLAGMNGAIDYLVAIWLLHNQRCGPSAVQVYAVVRS